MLPCGTLELSDLQVGQIVRWHGELTSKTSTWILLEESTKVSAVGNRNFKLWCLRSQDHSRPNHTTLCDPGMTTEYEFNHHNITSYQIVSVGE